MSPQTARDGIVQDVDALVREGLALAETVARRMEHRLGFVIEREELLSIARPVVLEVAREHDPGRAPFAPYLVTKVKWAMLDEARRLQRRRKLARRAAACAALERLAEDAEESPETRKTLGTEAEYQADLSQFLARRAAAMAVGLASVSDEPAEQAARETPEQRFSMEEMRRDLRAAIGRLPDRHRAIVERHYYDGEKFEAIAQDLGVSKSWASRLHAQAMDALAEVFREHA